MKLFLIGSGGFAAEVAEALSAQLQAGLAAIAGIAGIAGVYDDDTRLRRKPFLDLPYVGTIADLLDKPPSDCRYVLALSENLDRQEWIPHFDQAGLRPLTVQHPLASVSPTATIADGVYLAAFAFVGPRAFIGKHCILNVSASVGYGARLEDCVQLSPGVRISRSCRLGAGAFLGSNVVVAPGLDVGRQAKVGAGSFVHRNVPAGKFALGVPMRVID